MLRKRSPILIVLFCILGCSTAVSPVLPTRPLITLTPTEPPTVVPTVAITPTLALSPTQAPMETPNWSATSTPIQTQTLTEVTPMGGVSWWVTPEPKIERMDGWYTPYTDMNVRWGPRIDAVRRYEIPARGTVRVYAWLSSLPIEAWLCLDPPIGDDYLCTEAVALVYGGKEWGDLILEEEE